MDLQRVVVALALGSLIATTASGIPAQGLGPPSGYYDIPAGYDFPADKQSLEQMIANGDVAGERRHVWNVFAGMTQPTADGQHAIFETWYSEAETFQTGAAIQAAGPRRVALRFSPPAQLVGMRGHLIPQAAGTAILSEVMFNFANYDHIRSQHLYDQTTLTQLQQSGAPDPNIPGSRTVPPFPAASVSLKTLWWPIFPDRLTPMPVWDPDSNTQLPGGNPYSTWKRVVAIDPTRVNIPAGDTTTIQFLNATRPNAHVVSLKDDFHYLVVDAQMAATAKNNSRLRGFVRDVLGRDLQVGDYVAFLGTHMTTKEIDKWVWATFWWHDRPDDGPFAQDRPASLMGVWRHYLMTESYDVNSPKEPDGTPHIAFNPWLEGHFVNGVQSNCMNCHNRATTSADSFLPVMRGDPDLANDSAFQTGALRTDFLWSVIFDAK